MDSTRTKINKLVYHLLLIAVLSVSGRAFAQDLPDLVVTDLAVTSYTANSIAYSYTVANVGDAQANLEGPTPSDFDNVGVQAYLSADQIFANAGDIPAGGTVLGMSPLDPLPPGGTFSGSFSCTQTVDPTTHPYLVLKVDWGQVVDESDETNNTLAALIEGPPVADIDVSPLTLDFGKVDLDTSSAATVTLSNEGSADLTVTGIALQPGSSSDFSITFAPELPATIASGQIAEIDITYTPLAVDWSSGVLEIGSDDPDEPVAEVVLEGAGVVIDEKVTPVGGPVIVELMHKKKAKKKVTVKYDKVLEEGITKMVIKKPKAEEASPENCKLGYPAELLELETTAKVEGEITVSIDYSDILYEGSEKKLKMYHKSADGPWKEITLLVDIEAKEVIGKPDSFSDFGIFEVDAFGLINGLINDVLMLNLQQGISNSLDTKLSAALQAVDDFNACNDIAAINTLEAFVAAVQAQSGNKIPTEDANALIATAQEVISALSGP